MIITKACNIQRDTLNMEHLLFGKHIPSAFSELFSETLTYIIKEVEVYQYDTVAGHKTGFKTYHCETAKGVYFNIAYRLVADSTSETLVNGYINQHRIIRK